MTEVRQLTQAQQRLLEISSRTGYHAQDAAACDLGAQCVALVTQVVETNPWVKHERESYQCAFCRTYRTERELRAMDSQFLHGSNCLWQQARQLTEGERQQWQDAKIR